MQIVLRPAVGQDFDYCQRLYFAEMEWLIRKLCLDEQAQQESFPQQWQLAQVRIITLHGVDVGWLQSFTHGAAFFIAQLFVESPHQRRGIGTEVMKLLVSEAEQSNQAIRLNVVKISPAVKFYERLGFRIFGEDDRKFFMVRDPDIGGSPLK